MDYFDPIMCRLRSIYWQFQKSQIMIISFHKFLKLTKKKNFYLRYYLPICTYLNQNNPLCNNVYKIAIFIDEYTIYTIFFTFFSVNRNDNE